MSTTGRGQVYQVVLPLEQRVAHQLFQALDPLGQALLGEEQPGGRAPEVQLLGRRDERSHLGQIEIHPVILTDNRRLSRYSWSLFDAKRAACLRGHKRSSQGGPMKEIVGVAAGVPYVALPPAGEPDGAPLVVAWHLHDPPRTETAMAAALPLRGLPAWRVYLGLPLSGSRLPEGGLDAFFQLGYEDAVLKVFDPTCRQAVEEFPSALAAIREVLPAADGPLGLVGGSVGALVALGVLAGTDLPVGAVALVSPAIRLASVVALNERRFGVTYGWTEQSRAAAERLDFVARAEEIAKHDAAVLLVVGALDDEEGIRTPAEQLWQLLSTHAPDRTALTSIPGMAHALAEEPGLEPAPQTAHAERVDTVVAGWFYRHLTGSG